MKYLLEKMIMIIIILVLGIKPRALSLLRIHCITELYLANNYFYLHVLFCFIVRDHSQGLMHAREALYY
jgi:hypothetical protein